MDRSRKAERYKRIITQIDELMQKTTDPFARMSTIIAILHNKFDYFFWTGFYRLVDSELTVWCLLNIQVFAGQQLTRRKRK